MALKAIIRKQHSLQIMMQKLLRFQVWSDDQFKQLPTFLVSTISSIEKEGTTYKQL